MIPYTKADKIEIDEMLQGIANLLLLDSQVTPDLGLINGKMGTVVFFYKYARYSNKDFYEQYAGKLIDDILSEMLDLKKLNFSGGLTGIGWGIEYLVQNEFVEADTDELLAIHDKEIYQSVLKMPLSFLEEKDLYGNGLYYLSRFCNRKNKNDGISDHNKKLLLHLLNDIENLFKSDKVELATRQLHSIIYFLLGLQKAKLNVSDTIIFLLSNYLSNGFSVNLNHDLVSIKLLSSLIDSLVRTDFNTQPENLEKIFNQKQLSDIHIENIVLEDFIDIGWNPLLYDIDPMRLRIHNSIIINKLRLLKKGKHGYSQIQRDTNILIGIGLSLLKLVQKC